MTLVVHAGLALMRNKLWHYNEHLEVNGAKRWVQFYLQWNSLVLRQIR